MKNVVSFETAKALREAGFPVPEPNHGQFWYIEYTGELEVITFVGGNGVHRMYIPFLKGMNSCAKDAFLNGSVFAPTATDILREMGDRFVLSFFLVDGVANWTCAETMPTNDTKGAYFSPAEILNPAEACALAWLEKNKK